jgi:hypothetical protein
MQLATPFEVSEQYPGVVKKNTSEFPADNTVYARVEGPPGIFHRGIRGASNTVYVLCPEADEKAVAHLMKHAPKSKTGGKVVGPRQVNTKKMYDFSRKYLTTGSTANAPKDVFELFGGTKAPILMTTEHANRIEGLKTAQKQKREREPESDETGPPTKKAAPSLVERPKEKKVAPLASTSKPSSVKVAHKQAKIDGQLKERTNFEITEEERMCIKVMTRVLLPLLNAVKEP